MPRTSADLRKPSWLDGNKQGSKSDGDASQYSSGVVVCTRPLPMDHQVDCQSFRGDLCDDLPDESPRIALLEPYVRRLDVPHPVKVLGQGSQNRRVRRSGCWTTKP